MAITDGEFDALRRELDSLRSRQEILDLINAYGRGLDRLDADLIRRAYHPDAVDNHGPFTGGVDAFVPFAIECEQFFANTHHGITSHNCEIQGDTAHAESYVYFVVHMEADRIGLGYGRYIDRLERRDGKWAILVRHVIMDTTFEVPKSQWLGPDWEQLPARRDSGDMSYLRPLPIPSIPS